LRDSKLGLLLVACRGVVPEFKPHYGNLPPIRELRFQNILCFVRLFRFVSDKNEMSFLVVPSRRRYGSNTLRPSVKIRFCSCYYYR
jgi:hypothetical protein